MNYLRLLLFIYLILFPSVGGAQNRIPAVAGQFYPGSAPILKTTIEDLLKKVPELGSIDGEITAIVVPHAGYIYSGQTAAYSYKAIQNKHYDCILIIGVSHRHSFDGVSVWNRGKYSTPLGDAVIDKEAADFLIASSEKIDFVERAHTREHSIEVQVPFLQIVQPNVPIVPILTGDRNPESLNALVNALENISQDKNILMIASTDLAHYVSRNTARKMDNIGIEALRDFDYDRFLKELNRGATQFCGGGGTAVVIEAAKHGGADEFKILKYSDSGNRTGDSSSVVSYLSAVMIDNDKKANINLRNKSNDMSFSLNDEQKKTLLLIARKAITNIVSGTNEAEVPEISDPVLTAQCGAFVTITEHGELRGCIGYTEAFKPLYMTVHECAISAALHDPRFPALHISELDQIHLEISVLSPLTNVENIEDIEVGRDGLMITKDHYRGLLLPQVAAEYRWDRNTFLEHTCRKAGLPKDAYKDKETLIQSFTAVIFGE